MIQQLLAKLVPIEMRKLESRKLYGGVTIVYIGGEERNVDVWQDNPLVSTFTMSRAFKVAA